MKTCCPDKGYLRAGTHPALSPGWFPAALGAFPPFTSRQRYRVVVVVSSDSAQEKTQALFCPGTAPRTFRHFQSHQTKNVQQPVPHEMFQEKEAVLEFNFVLQPINCRTNKEMVYLPSQPCAGSCSSSLQKAGSTRQLSHGLLPHEWGWEKPRKPRKKTFKIRKHSKPSSKLPQTHSQAANIPALKSAVSGLKVSTDLPLPRTKSYLHHTQRATGINLCQEIFSLYKLKLKLLVPFWTRSAMSMSSQL